MTAVAPEIPETLSPFWLRLYGKWIHLEGVRPAVPVAPGRAFSELVTVDGYRYVQQAPRGPRTWTLDYEYGTAAATAALESAAYTTVRYRDPLTRTLLMDRNDAKVNMVDPDLNTAWAVEWDASLGVPQPLYIINVGEGPDKPIWLPSYDLGNRDGTLPEAYTRRAYFPVIPGVVYTAALWSVVNVSTSILRINDADTNILLGQYVAVGTVPDPANPQLARVTFTAPASGIIELEMDVSYMNTGLMLYEGDCPPDYYRAGRRMPCQVAVQDPALTTNLIWPKKCNPCDLPRENATFTVQEVGTTMGVDLVGA